MKLKCQRCNHQWDYTGYKKYFTSCPECRTSVKIKSYLNNNCPKCGEKISPYHYIVYNGKKYCKKCGDEIWYKKK